MNVSVADQAVATACCFLFRSLGAAVGVSVIGIIIQDVLGMKLAAALGHRDLPLEKQAIVRDSYQAGIQSGFLTCSAILAAAALCVIFWRDQKMSR